MTRKEVVKCSLGRMAGTSPPRPRFLKTLCLVLGLTSVSPTSGYPTLDLYRNGCLARVVHSGIHPFDHCSFQPSLCVRRLLCFTLDDNLVVANEYRHGPEDIRKALKGTRSKVLCHALRIRLIPFLKSLAPYAARADVPQAALPFSRLWVCTDWGRRSRVLEEG
jgi:hypothetical protein